MIELARAFLAIATAIAAAGLVAGVIWARRRLRGEPASPWLLAPLAALALVFGVLTIASFPFQLSAEQNQTESRELTP